ncbi:MAG: thioether cross-link-forming SCIFF peptide maturase [Syntrophomonadaceae bacterium]|jgi:uncharacterized protein|nr:thioether cross-link-forming SCIFF peptide maturase [Syntrophomonadaceae bacterium]
MELEGYDFSAHIHLFTCRGRNFLLDVNSGAIHLLDRTAVDLVDKIIQNKGFSGLVLDGMPCGSGEIEETLMELKAASDEGSLFSYPEKITVNFQQMHIKALCLNVAHLCNMNCVYCFAHQGAFGKNKGLMPWLVAKAAVDFLITASADIKNLEIDFFGGEPLLNFEVVKQTVAYGRSKELKNGKKINFTLTTNGVLLNDEAQDFIIDNDISVILSLDGRPEINDAKRVLNNGEGSYHRILPNFRKMVAKKPVSYYIRGTYTRDNTDFSRDLAHMAEQGFKNISLEPAVGADLELAIKERDLPAVLAEYENLTGVLLEAYHKGREISFFHYNLDLQKGPCLAKRNSGCGAGTEYAAVTPEGDIYPCHQFIGKDEFKMGNVIDKRVDRLLSDRFAGSNLNNKSRCEACWARYFCGGGCHANHYFTNNDLLKPVEVSCSMHKKRIEQAIYLDIEKKLT